jgi:isopenicillin-N epimerase
MRESFLLDPSLVFLNHGSFGACPREVLDAQHAWQREMERNPVEFLGRRSAALLARARERLAAFVGAGAAELVFVNNATTGVNVMARSLSLASGDEIVTTDHEYGACMASWEAVCERSAARLVRVPLPLPFRRDEAVDRLFAAVTKRTRAVYVSHVTSTTALILPAAEICRRARAHGIVSLVDGAHAPGHLELNIDEVGADMYTGNCHKWMCAPKGAGFLQVRSEHHERVAPPVVSWGACAAIEGYEGFDAYTGSTILERRLQWLGTRDISAFLAVPAAIDFLQHHHWRADHARCHALALETRDRIGTLTGLAPIATDDDVGQMVAIDLPPCDGEALRAELYERHHIEVPITSHAGRQLIRPAFSFYSTDADADALVDALRTILQSDG